MLFFMVTCIFIVLCLPLIGALFMALAAAGVYIIGFLIAALLLCLLVQACGPGALVFVFVAAAIVWIVRTKAIT